MGHVALNSTHEVIDASITFPLVGPWIAEVSAHATEAITGAATITIADGAITLVGTVATGSTINDRADLRIFGGAAKLQTSLDGKAYAFVPARLVIKDLLAEIGETLDPASDAAPLDSMLRHWCRAAGPAQLELQILLTQLGVTWRITPAGLLWIGTDTWPETALDSWTVDKDDQSNGLVKIAADLPKIYPGETWRGQHVTTVVHRLAGPSLRTEVTVVDP